MAVRVVRDRPIVESSRPKAPGLPRALVPLLGYASRERPEVLDRCAVLALQRTLGNAAVAALLQRQVVLQRRGCGCGGCGTGAPQKVTIKYLAEEQ